MKAGVLVLNGLVSILQNVTLKSNTFYFIY